MKRAKVGQRVRVSDPVGIACRFFDQHLRYVVGTGGRRVPRIALDGPGTVEESTQGGKRARVELDDGGDLWLDSDALAAL